MSKKWIIFGSIFLLSFINYSEDPSIERNSVERRLHYRDYYTKATNAEIKDMRFILKTLAQKSLLSLWGYQTKLEEAGDRIDHVHPLRFLLCIFSNDEFIVYVNNIKDRGSWVWEKFVAGFERSFGEEADRDNLKEEFIADFATTLDLKYSLIAEKIENQDWEGLIKTLIVHVEREGEPGKYDQ